MNPLLEEKVQYFSSPHPFTQERVDGYLPSTMTVLEMIEHLQPSPMLRKHGHVYLGDEYIPREFWHKVKPRGGTILTINIVPQGGGGGSGESDGDKALRTVLTVAVIVAAVYIGNVYGPGLASLMGATSTAGVAGVVAGVSAVAGTVGILAVNALVPPPVPKLEPFNGNIGGLGGSSLGQDSPTLFVRGARNRVVAFGIVPRILGKMRVVPPMLRPYTELEGNDQYLRLCFIFGYGPITMVEPKIGETDISGFTGIETSFRDGSSGQDDLTIYTNDVDEDALSILLTEAASWHTRTTGADAEEISVDIAFGGGLVSFNNQGGKDEITVDVDVEYRVTSPSGAWVSAGTISTSEKRTSAVRRGLRWTVAKNQYDVRLRRTTADTSSSRIADLVTWTTLRTIKISTGAITMDGISTYEMRIKATDQLNGVVDTFNAVIQSKADDWNGVSAWVANTATSNPASLFRTVLQDSANARAIPDARIDLDSLQDWHEFCATHALEFNTMLDSKSSVDEILNDISSTGRARRTRVNGKWGVAIDEAQGTIVQHFTPRNTSGFSSIKLFKELPHAFRVRFINRNEGYKQDERIVYDDTYHIGNSTRFEELQMPGVTSPEEAWKHGRYHIAVARLRPEVYSFNCDFEHLVCGIGDLIRVTHDVPLWGLHSGRVKSLTDNGAYISTIVLDELVTMSAGSPTPAYNLRVRKSSTGESVVINITNVPGESATLTPDGNYLIGDANVGDLVMFGLVGTESTELIVKEIIPSSDLTATIVAIDESPAIHTADTSGIPAFSSNITEPAGRSAPSILSVRSDETVLLRDTDGTYHVRILISLLPTPIIGTALSEYAGIQVRYREKDSSGPWDYLPLVDVDAEEISIRDVEEGFAYDIEIRYLRKTGESDGWNALAGHTVTGKSTAPADVIDFAVQQNQDLITFAWHKVIDVDLEGYEIRFHDAAQTILDWDSAMRLTSVLAGTTITTTSVPPGTWKFYIKAIDTGKRESSIASIKEFTVSSNFNLINTTVEEPFALAKLVGGFIESTLGNAIVPFSTFLDSTDDSVMDEVIPNPKIMTYTTDQYSLSFADTVRLWGEFVYKMLPGFTGPPNIAVQVSVSDESAVMWGSDDAPMWSSDSDPMWDYTEYETIGVSEKTAQFIIFRLTVFNDTGPNTVPYITNFSRTIDILPRTESHKVVVGAGGTLLNFDRQFQVVPKISVTENGNNAYIGGHSGATVSQATIHLKTDAGVATAGNAIAVVSTT